MMQKLNNTSFSTTKVLVLGDIMIDRYHEGSITRMSPEANVPVVDIKNVEDRLGGAANVALNVQSLGANATILSISGEDEDATVLQSRFDENQIQSHIIKDSTRPTTVKNRIYNDNEYVLRFDKESVQSVSHTIEKNILAKLSNLLADENFDIAILQDYNKGFFTTKVIEKSIELLKAKGVKVVVDPKKDNFFTYQNVDLFKPNLKEVSMALNMEISPKIMQHIKIACSQLINKLNCQNVLLTLSEYGAVWCDNDNFEHFPASKNKVLDVSGAGDTVIAIAALMYSQGFSIEKIGEVVNIAGGIAIAKKGVATVSIKEIMSVVKQLN